MGAAGHLGDDLNMARAAVGEDIEHLLLGQIIPFSDLDMDGVLRKLIAALRIDRLAVFSLEDLTVFDPLLVDLGVGLIFKAAAELEHQHIVAEKKAEIDLGLEIFNGALVRQIAFVAAHLAEGTRIENARGKGAVCNTF